MQGNKGSNRSDQNLAMLAHDLCSELNGIQGMTELLGSTRLNGEQKRWVEAAKLSIHQMHWLISGITLQRQGAVFPIPPQPCLIDGPGLLEQAIHCHTKAALAKNNLLLLLIDPELPQYWFADTRLLRQVIDNLLGNAIKFTQAGKVVLEARPATRGYGSESSLELLVRDTGIGFSPSFTRHIFKPYEQAGPDIGLDYGGTGLGLSICHKIVSGLNGQIDCSSKPGAGSSFRVLLPDLLERGHQKVCEMSSGLLSSIMCRISIKGDLGRSLKFLLQRMGVVVEICSKEEKYHKDVEFLVEISAADSSGHHAIKNHSLVLKPEPISSSITSSLPGIRRLQPPFLASTLGPVLIEMAIDRALVERRAQLPD
jgi:hypothetical protein